MSLVQDNLLRLAQKISPVTKSGKRFQSTTGGSVVITGAASNGGPNLIRITAANHGFVTGDYVTIYGVSGTTEANNSASNPYWVVTWISSSTFDLVGSTFAHAFSGSGGTAVKFMVGSVDGSGRTRQRLLDIYNESRFALFNAIYETKSYREFSECVAKSYASITIAAISGLYRTITKPTGFIKLIGMTDSASTKVKINVLPDYMLNDVKAAVTTTLTPSNTNLLAFDTGTTWSIVGDFGTTPALVDYYGITNWVWATDVLPNTSVEIFRADLESILIELGVAISKGMSNADALALAKQLLNERK